MFTTPPSRPLPHRVYHALTRTKTRALNLPLPGTTSSDVQDPADLLRRMRAVMDELGGVGYRADGRVDYAALQASDVYARYAALKPTLTHLDLSTLATDAERTAFWINLYNLLAIDVIISHKAAAIQDVPGVFFGVGYVVGGHFYSLHDIEQGVLRANRGYPGLLGPQFAEGDPRAVASLANVDPRVHFALVCAAASCPAIRLYHADDLDTQLDLATHVFVNGGGVDVNPAARTVTLSKIFQWYAPDFGAPFTVTLGFGSAAPILRWVAPYLADEAACAALENGAATFGVSFVAYDWSLNATP